MSAVWKPACLAAALVLGLGACGGDDDGAETAETASDPLEMTACELAPRDTVEELLGEPVDAEGNLNEVGGGVDECIYPVGPESPVLVVTIHRSGGAEQIAGYQAFDGAERVDDLGDEAVFTEIAGFPRLSVLTGDVLVKSSVPDELGRDGARDLIRSVLEQIEPAD